MWIAESNVLCIFMFGCFMSSPTCSAMLCIFSPCFIVFFLSSLCFFFLSHQTAKFIIHKRNLILPKWRHKQSSLFLFISIGMAGGRKSAHFLSLSHFVLKTTIFSNKKRLFFFKTNRIFRRNKYLFQQRLAVYKQQTTTLFSKNEKKNMLAGCIWWSDEKW